MLSIIAVNVIYTLLVPDISISGHLGGAIGGAIAMLLLPAASLRTPRPVRIVVAVLWVVAVAARPRLGRRFLESNRREYGVPC